MGRWFREPLMADDLERMALWAGWKVKREAHVGDRKRVDLRLDSPEGTVLVELKGPAGAKTTMTRSTEQLRGYLDATPGGPGAALVFGSIGDRGWAWLHSQRHPEGMTRCDMVTALGIVKMGPENFFASYRSAGVVPRGTVPVRSHRFPWGVVESVCPDDLLFPVYARRSEAPGTGTDVVTGRGAREHPQWLSIVPLPV